MQWSSVWRSSIMSMGLPLRVSSTFLRYTVNSSNSSPSSCLCDGESLPATPKLQLEDADPPTNDSLVLAPLVTLMWLWSSKSPKYSWTAPRWLLVVQTVEVFPLRGPFPLALAFPFPLPLAKRSCSCNFSNCSWISLIRFSEFSSICFSFCSKSSLLEQFRSGGPGGFGGFFLL